MADDTPSQPSANEPYAIGERVYYFSRTHGAWLPAVVLGLHMRDGIVETYDLDIKREASASMLLPGPMARDAEPPETLASSSTSVDVNQPRVGTAEPDEPIAQTLVESEPGAQTEVQGPEEGELREEDVDAVSAVSAVESIESVVEIDDRVDAISLASTQAPGLVPLRGHGRQAPRRPRTFAPPCGCDCHNVPNDLLGPRSRRAQRCACPCCGHRSVEQGQGCHYRIRVARDFAGIVICPQCQDFCAAFLAWGDIFYDHGAVWEGREQAVRVTSGSSGDLAPGGLNSLG